MDDKLKSLRESQKKAFQQAENAEDAFFNEASEGWDNVGLDKMDSILSKIDQRIDARVNAAAPAPQTKVRKLWMVWATGIAASILLLVAGIRFFTEEPAATPTYTADALYEAYYKPLSGPEPVYRGDNDFKKPKDKVASMAYDEKEFDIAILHYKELLNENPGSAKYTLFLGLSLMSYERYDDAILLYNSYKPTGVTYDEDIRWYLGLAHLKKGEFNTAQAILESLAKNPKSYYQEGASEIIAKIPK